MATRVLAPSGGVESLKTWKTGFNDQNLEPVLILEFHSGRTLFVQMPAQSARDMARGLEQEATRATPPDPSKRN